MAKRKRGAASTPTRRPPGRMASDAAAPARTPGRATRDRATPAAHASSKAGRPRLASRPPAGAAPSTRRPDDKKAKEAPARVVQESTGRAAKQPGGRRTVELFARALSDEAVAPTLPSSLTLEPRASAVRTGRATLAEERRAHHETDPGMTAGDIDADWQSAYSVGDEAPGGDNPTPDQVVVDDVGRALGVEYDDAEELKASEKIASRDRHRWELDPASAEDYPERTKARPRKKR